MKKSKITCLVLFALLFVSALFSACGKKPSDANNTPNMQGMVETENFVSIQQTQQPTTNTAETKSTEKADNSTVKTDEKQQIAKIQSNLD